MRVFVSRVLRRIRGPERKESNSIMEKIAWFRAS
jgi:hypothetical protein